MHTYETLSELRDQLNDRISRHRDGDPKEAARRQAWDATTHLYRTQMGYSKAINSAMLAVAHKCINSAHYELDMDRDELNTA